MHPAPGDGELAVAQEFSQRAVRACALRLRDVPGDGEVLGAGEPDVEEPELLVQVLALQIPGEFVAPLRLGPDVEVAAPALDDGEWLVGLRLDTLGLGEEDDWELETLRCVDGHHTDGRLVGGHPQGVCFLVRDVARFAERDECVERGLARGIEEFGEVGDVREQAIPVRLSEDPGVQASVGAQVAEHGGQPALPPAVLQLADEGARPCRLGRVVREEFGQL